MDLAFLETLYDFLYRVLGTNPGYLLIVYAAVGALKKITEVIPCGDGSVRDWLKQNCYDHLVIGAYCVGVGVGVAALGTTTWDDAVLRGLTLAAFAAFTYGMFKERLRALKEKMIGHGG